MHTHTHTHMHTHTHTPWPWVASHEQVPSLVRTATQALLKPYDDPANVTLHAATGESGVAARDPKLLCHSQECIGCSLRRVGLQPATRRAAACGA